MLVLVINPGSTSTKLALYNGSGPVVVETIDHSRDGWAVSKKTVEQLEERLAVVQDFLRRHGVQPKQLSAVVGRGGLLRPVKSGTYMVNEAMLDDLRQEYGGRHASNLGGLLSWRIASSAGILAFIVDPVAVDEFEEVSRLSGFPDIPRRSLLHALNMKACARRAARDLERPLSELYLVIAHLGSGFSISPCYKGYLTDVNNSNEEGPFTVERAGTVPHLVLLDLFDRAQDVKKIKAVLTSEAGMYAHLKTKDARLVESMAAEDPRAHQVFSAMAYQVAKEICAMALTYPEMPDAVVITGGLAKSGMFLSEIRKYTGFLGKHLVYPGEDEMEALALGALRVLRKEEPYRVYPGGEEVSM